MKDLPYYEVKFREYLKRYHPDKYEELILEESMDRGY